MSILSTYFDENEIVLNEPALTTDDVVELYVNGDYISTISAEHVLEALQSILEDDVNDDASIEEDGSEWLKSVALRIAAAAFRNWANSVDD